MEVLESELRSFQIEIPLIQRQALTLYCHELVHWNKKINLTGLSGADMVRRLVVEPVWIGLQLKPDGVLADIGSGNGSPAIPLYVVSKLRKAHLIEARARRAAFLRHLTTALTLNDVVVHRARFEEIVSELEPVDWVSLQGVAFSSQLLDSIQKVALATTTIVWITSPNARTPLNPLRTLEVPFTGTRVFLFRLNVS